MKKAGLSFGAFMGSSTSKKATDCSKKFIKSGNTTTLSHDKLSNLGENGEKKTFLFHKASHDKPVWVE
ncbi:hypothetical protein Nepgr_010537 [Nepenthes gracilis]|uniref:Uncharacterized protein n=1 Tax=Nepenthes gracilis TaxID=150966 RepID=A0AAD3XL62_NEPGR|nr:hypothetical protein Nepgr_010537 [Nepenthes gracilis]